MSDLWINIRFGFHHLQIGITTFRISKNEYQIRQKQSDPNWKFFEIYEFFNLI